MKSSTVFVIAIAVVFVAAALSTQMSPAAVSRVAWKHDLSSASSAALKSNKPMIVDFYSDWCAWCKQLDRDTYSDSKVGDLSRKFVCVKVDGEKHPELLKKYGVVGYPTVLFLDSKSNVIMRIDGYRDASQFLKDMKDVLKAK